MRKVRLLDEKTNLIGLKEWRKFFAYISMKPISRLWTAWKKIPVSIFCDAIISRISKKIHYKIRIRHALRNKEYEHARSLIKEIKNNNKKSIFDHRFLVPAARACGLYRQADFFIAENRKADKKFEKIERIHDGEMRVYKGEWLHSCESIQFKPEKRNILHLLENSLPYRTSGYTYRSHYILKNTLTLGYNPAAVTRAGFPWDSKVSNPAAEDSLDGVTYYHINTPSSLSFSKMPLDEWLDHGIKKNLDIAQSFKPELLHAHSNFKNGLICDSLSKALGIPWVYEMRGIWEDTQVASGTITADSEIYRYQREQENLCMERAHAVVTISECQRCEIIERGIDKKKVFVVPNAVDSNLFPIQQKNEGLAAKLGLANKKVLGYMGTLWAYEGIDTLIDAFARIETQRDDLALLIVGSGKKLDDLKAQVSAHGLKNVCFPGRVPHHEILNWYSLLDLFVIPRAPYRVCKYVTPLKPYEAMSTGCPLLVSDLPALREVIDTSGAGTSFEAGNSASLAAKAIEILDDQDCIARMSTAGSQWVRNNRQWQHVVPKYKEIYNHII